MSPTSAGPSTPLFESAGEAVRFSPEAKAIHGRVGPTNARFLEFVERHPELLRPETFRRLEQRPDLQLYPYPLVSWPLFVDPDPQRELERASQGLAGLLRGLPQRLFGTDPERLAEVYGLNEQETFVAASLLAAGGTKHMLSRGDFVFTARGLRCLEFNFVSNLGGWRTAVWARSYLGVEPIAGFLREVGAAARWTDVIFELLLHVAREVGSRVSGFYAVLVTDPGARISNVLAEYARVQLRRALEITGTSGELGLCSSDELEERAGVLYLRGRRVDAVIESFLSQYSQPIFRCLLAGSLISFNGPLEGLLTSKLNLAFLSEMAEDGRLAPAEEEVVRSFVPWTRRVRPEATPWGDEEVYLPEVIKGRREQLVLKEERSSAGRNVFLGLTTEPDRWSVLVNQAMVSGRWIVQELSPSLPFLNRYGELECAAFDVIWGAFAFGPRYGGCFMRAKEQTKDRIVNTAQGALVTVAFETGGADSRDGAGVEREARG